MRSKWNSLYQVYEKFFIRNMWFRLSSNKSVFFIITVTSDGTPGQEGLLTLSGQQTSQENQSFILWVTLLNQVQPPTLGVLLAQSQVLLGNFYLEQIWLSSVRETCLPLLRLGKLLLEALISHIPFLRDLSIYQRPWFKLLLISTD